ncbi:hypothetical protein ACRALDRAFT_1062013, partial [Sodiomyces alcalophilus JCM 7366]|uniref:uncharacterized protein n=1 Tax=Sodiomyces alcalophilus JCM 7366 TaxID=591952 RepID=UPI0039B4E633
MNKDSSVELYVGKDARPDSRLSEVDESETGGAGRRTLKSVPVSFLCGHATGLL